MNRVTVSMAICAALLSTACAAFRGGELGEVGPLTPSVGNKRSVSVVLTGSLNFNGNTQDANAQLVKAWTDAAVKAYDTSGLFSKVTTGIGDSDVRAEIFMLDEAKASIPLAFITGLTLYTIPSSATDTLATKTVFKDRTGRVLGTYEKRESVTQWQHLFMIPLLPFKAPVAVVPGVLRDIHTATLAAAQKDGVL